MALANNMWTRFKESFVLTNNRTMIAVDSSASGSSLNIPDYDYFINTYVASGNGAGQLETTTYKTGGAGGTTVATVTLTYDSSDRLLTMTKV